MSTDHESGHGRNSTWTLRGQQAPEHIREFWVGTSWIVEVAATGRRDGKAFQATHLLLTSLRTTPDALLHMECAQQLQPDQPLPPGAFKPGLYLLPLYDDSRKDAIELLSRATRRSSARNWRPGRLIPTPGRARAAWPCSRSGSRFVSTTWSVIKGRRHCLTTRWTNPSWRICAA